MFSENKDNRYNGFAPLWGVVSLYRTSSCLLSSALLFVHGKEATFAFERKIPGGLISRSSFRLRQSYRQTLWQVEATVPALSYTTSV
jgi:hypothetical protein